MKKVYKLKGLDCAHCAQKLQGLIQNVEGVEDAKITFVLQKLAFSIKSENPELVIEKVLKIIDDFGEGEIEVKEI